MTPHNNLSKEIQTEFPLLSEYLVKSIQMNVFRDLKKEFVPPTNLELTDEQFVMWYQAYLREVGDQLKSLGYK